MISRFLYRPEIDGLRAVAVLAVVLFHADLSCKGGYVGVDVFFVISGFLITTLIWKELESGRFSFAHFWERRARRIVPAIVLITVAVLVAGWFLLLPADFIGLGRASAAQAAFAANFYYWWDSGYFAAAADEKPLLHTWSLAVEEQFYMFFPFVMWALFRWTARSKAVVISALTFGFVISLGASIYGLSRFPSATFYLLPTRGWELLTGALVAFLPPALSLSGRRRLNELLALIGGLLIIAPVFIYSKNTPFPGLAALPPCAGTALIIWANGRTDNRIPTVLGAALSARPIVFVGLVSYSFYLWHWPFLAFSRYLALAPLSKTYRVTLVCIAFLLAILSWKYVEMTFRARKIAVSRKSLYVFAGAGLAIVMFAGLTCVAMRGFPQRFPAKAQGFADAASEMGYATVPATDDIGLAKLIPIGASDSKSRPTVLVWGDSHAQATLPAFDSLLKEKGLAGRAAIYPSTAPVLGWFRYTQSGLNKESIGVNEAICSYVERNRIPNIILAANWSNYAESGGSSDDSFNAALLTTVKRLAAAGSRPWILLDVPVHSFNVPRALSRSVVYQTDLTLFSTKPDSKDAYDRIAPQTVIQIKALGVGFIDPKPAFLDSTGRYYVVHVNDIALYRDGAHLTPKGATLILLPFLRKALALGDE